MNNKFSFSDCTCTHSTEMNAYRVDREREGESAQHSNIQTKSNTKQMFMETGNFRMHATDSCREQFIMHIVHRL